MELVPEMNREPAEMVKDGLEAVRPLCMGENAKNSVLHLLESRE